MWLVRLDYGDEQITVLTSGQNDFAFKPWISNLLRYTGKRFNSGFIKNLQLSILCRFVTRHGASNRITGKLETICARQLSTHKLIFAKADGHRFSHDLSIAGGHRAPGSEAWRRLPLRVLDQKREIVVRGIIFGSGRAQLVELFVLAYEFRDILTKFCA